MCQQIVQFCSGSAKLLLYGGGSITIISAIAIGYIACSTNALYLDIDSTKANSMSYYLQLVAAVYLGIVAILSSFAAYYDQKHSIRSLAVITSVNFVLALTAILLVPTDVSLSFKPRLDEAQKIYNFTDRYPETKSTDTVLGPSNGKNRSTRFANDTIDNQSNSASSVTLKLNTKEATKIWDSLQARGCCGFLSYTEWNQAIPKSCCLNATIEESTQKTLCATVDLEHQKACKEILESTSLDLLFVLAFIALVNLYLATVTGVSTYRTFHYNEASQNAYT